MDPFEFLKKIDGLRDQLPDETVVDLYESAESVIDDFKDKIKDLEDVIDDQSKDIENLKDENSDLQESVDKYKNQEQFFLEGAHKNIVTEAAITNLFDNLDHIPVVEIENLISKFQPK